MNDPAELNKTFKLNLVTWALLLIIAAAVVIAFSPAGHAKFVDLDDELYVFGNAHVLNGLSLESVKWDFTTKTGGRWMPVTWLSLQLDATIANFLKGSGPDPRAVIGGLPDSTIYHINNIIFQILASWILFLFLNRATRLRWPSFIVALLWAIHPLRVESVLWVTERKDMLAGFFGFLAMYLYICWRDKNKSRYFWLASVSMTRSLWAKAMFVTLPALLMVLDFWPLGRIANWRDLIRSTCTEGHPG